MKLEKNASACMKALPFWMLPYTFYMYYLGLFLMEKGLSSTQITLLMTVSNATSLAFSFVASPIVDKMGRKKSLLVFDLLSSSLPAAILLISPRFIPAMIAMGMTGLNKVMSTAYYLTMIEDTSDRNSIDAMNMFNIITVVAGVATPLAGMVVSKTGIEKGEELFLISAVVLMPLQAVIRHFNIDEPPTGQEIKDSRTKFILKNVIMSYKGTIRTFCKNKKLLAALFVNSLMYVYYNLCTTTSLLFTPYFASFRKLEGVALASIGAVYSVGTLFSMLVINPHITRKNIYNYSFATGLVSMGGFAMIILCPIGNSFLLMVAVILLAISYGVLKSTADAILAIETNGEFGAGIYSFSFVVSSVFSILALQLIDVLYIKSPNWLFGLSAIFVAIINLICLPNLNLKGSTENV